MWGNTSSWQDNGDGWEGVTTWQHSADEDAADAYSSNNGWSEPGTSSTSTSTTYASSWRQLGRTSTTSTSTETSFCTLWVRSGEVATGVSSFLLAAPFPDAWGDRWEMTLTSSTTTVGPEPLQLPNNGLFPEVRPARIPFDGNETGLMRITKSEIALLQESGASRQHIRGVVDLLATLDAEQLQGSGPEARWSLARLLQRVVEAQETIDATIRVLNRRLRPRGVLPVQRVPGSETERWRRFMWGRQYSGLFRDCLENSMMTPLQPGESEGVVGASGSSSEEPARDVVADQRNSSPSPTHCASRNRSRSRSRTSTSCPVQSENSDFALNSEGEMVYVPDAPLNVGGHGPPVPVPVHLVTLEPVGIWREPVEETVEEEERLGDAGSGSPATTSTSTTGWVATSATSGWTTSTTSCWTARTTSWTPALKHGVKTVVGESQCHTMTTTTVWPLFCNTSTTTTTSSSSSVTMGEITWPSDIVRDAVNLHLVHGGPADVVQFVHYVLERQRHLRHVDRLLADAIAEALNWIQVPLSAEAMNAATYDRRIGAVAEREARHGSGVTDTVPSPARDP